MSLIRSKHTKPEMAVRSMLYHMGFRFRLHRRNLPGHPDIVLPRYKAAIFVHGCFWHFHQNCTDGKIPKSNREYWQSKLMRNAERDVHDLAALKDKGWSTMVIWECEMKKNPDQVQERAISFLHRES